jgi:cytidine deaminase
MADTRTIDREALLAHAREARDRAYAPYSEYRVGAAVFTGSGKVFVGANVENASYGLTVCAERVAAWAAVVAGERTLIAMAVAGEPGKRSVPCGACLQVLSEFGPDMEIIVENESGAIEVRRLSELLPEAFSLDTE